jgi:hypothetical protein
VASDADSDEGWDDDPTDELSLRFSSLEWTMANLEKLMLLSCRPTTAKAITALRRNSGDHEASSNTADDLILYNRMMQAFIDRRKLELETKADCSHSDKLQALRPYHCTYPACSTGSKLYHSRSDWMEHEKIAHQQLWRCRDHHEFSCHSRDAFERHLMAEHRSLKEIHRKAWMDIYKPTIKNLRRHCPICLARTDELVDQTLVEHIAEHLEQFALRAYACKASDAALHVLQLFDGSQSRQPPNAQDNRAHASEVDVVCRKIADSKFSATRGTADAVQVPPSTSGVRNMATALAWKKKDRDGDVDLTWKAAQDVSLTNLDAQGIPRSFDNPMIADRPHHSSLAAIENCQQKRPSWYQRAFQKHLYQPPGETNREKTPLPYLQRDVGAFYDTDWTPISMADKERNPFSPRIDLLTTPNLNGSVSAGRPHSPLQRRASERSDDSDPWSFVPTHNRPPRSPSPRDVPQRRKSPTPPQQRDMSYDSQHTFRYPKYVFKPEHAHHQHPDPVPMVSPKPPSREGRLRSLQRTSSPPLAAYLIPPPGGRRRQSIGSDPGNRHKSGTSAAGTLRTNVSAMDDQLPTGVGPLELDPGAADHFHGSPWQNRAQEFPSIASYNSIARPTRSAVPRAQSQLAGERQPGMKIGSDSVRSKLFPSFKQRPSSFFIVGKVFLTLWSEPAGGHSTTTSGNPGTVLNNREESLSSKVRRFVVVRKGENHCYALPITTYNGRGVASHGVNKSEHAIIHSSRTAPSARWDEHPRPGETGMMPFPIRVDIESTSEHLHEMSRLDLGGITRIDHDALVEDYGQVSKESMSHLLRAFRAMWRHDEPIESVEDDHEDWILLDDTGGENDDDDEDDNPGS